MRIVYDSIDTIRGIAISAVVINHYLNHNVSGDYLGFASLWISLFFMVSGYSIYNSLAQAMANDHRLGPRNLLRFYLLRVVRIFPLFWAAYLVQMWLMGRQVYPYTLLGLHGDGHFWFIPAILQCYLISPLVFMLIQRSRVITAVLILALYICSNLIINAVSMPVSLLHTLNYLHLNWHDTYFLYITIFSFSMLLPQCIHKWESVGRSEKRFYLLLLFSVTMIFLVSAKWQDGSSLLYQSFITTLIPILLITVFSIYLLANRFHSPILSWLGRTSYSIYLFHIIYLYLINLVFEYRKDSTAELIITLALLPLFLLTCRIFDNGAGRLSTFFKKKVVFRTSQQP